MMLRLLGAGALSMLIAGPAFAVGANCADQIAAIKATLSDHPDAKASLGSKVEEADRLCKAHKEEAQNMARQIRERLPQAGTTAGQGASSGSGTSTGGAWRELRAAGDAVS